MPAQKASRMHIAIVTPVKNRAWCLPDFLASIRALDYPRKELTIIFLDDGSTDGSLAILREFARRYRVQYRRIVVEATTGTGEHNTSSRDGRRWAGLYEHLAALRARLLDRARTEGAEAVLATDSDALLSPGLLRELLAHDVPIVGTLQMVDCTLRGSLGVVPCRPPRYINAGYTRPNGLYRALRTWPTDSLIEVGVTGGVCLLGPAIVSSDLTYTPGERRGEDLVFCDRVRAAGHAIYLDTTVRTIHIMEPQFLAAARRDFRTLFGCEVGERPPALAVTSDGLAFSVVIPFRGMEDRPHLTRVVERWRALFPACEVIVEGDGEMDGPFNKSRAINRGVAQAATDILVIADADCWPDRAPVDDLVGWLANGTACWGYPFQRMVFVSAAATREVLDGSDPQTPATRMQPADGIGPDCPGFCMAVTRKAFRTINGFDERFVGWGGEDTAARHALRALCGMEVRTGGDMAHLYHDRARSDTHYGNNATLALRYAQASRGSYEAMRALVTEEEHGGPDARTR